MIDLVIISLNKEEKFIRLKILRIIISHVSFNQYFIDIK